MKSYRKALYVNGLMLGAATALATIFAALPVPALAQGWKTEVSEAGKKQGSARKKRTATARSAPKAQTWADVQRASAAKPIDIRPASAQPKAAMAPWETAIPDVSPGAMPDLLADDEPPVIISSAPRSPAVTSAMPAASVKPAQSAGPAPVPQPPAAQAQADAMPEEEDELLDPFVDVRLLQRPVDGEVLTTQVVPTEPPNRVMAQTAPAEQSPRTTAQLKPADRNVASQYCSNIADAAIDARIAWQRQNLAEAEKQITARTLELEAKTAEYLRWLARRDEFSQKAQKVIIDIYTKMKPDAAALQLAALDEETAAAVIVKLEARVASAVMNEMEPTQAAKLTAIISGSSKGPVNRMRPPPGTGNRS